MDCSPRRFVQSRYSQGMLLLLLCLMGGVTCGDLLANTTTLPFARTAVSSIQVENKIYFVGGFELHDQIATNKIEVFDINTQKIVQQLELPVARGFISPAVIHPNLYFIGGRSAFNCPLLWDSTELDYIPISTQDCGSTVRTPQQVSIHNSKLTVLGYFSADFYLMDNSTWYYSEKLTSWMQHLAGGITLVSEDLIVCIGGFNFTSKQQYNGAWIYNSTSNELQTFENVTTIEAGLRSRSFNFAHNTIAVWIQDRCFVHRLGSSMWYERLTDSPFVAVSFPDTTFVVDKSGYWQFSWQNNSVQRISVDNALSAFEVSNQFVILRPNEALIYDGAWTSTPTSITSVKSVTAWFDKYIIESDIVTWYLPTTRTFTPTFFSGVAAIRAFDQESFLVFQQDGSIAKYNDLGSSDRFIWDSRMASQFVTVIGRDIVDAGNGQVLVNLTSQARFAIYPSATTRQSIDGVALMQTNSQSTFYDFIDIYNYETGVWSLSSPLQNLLARTVLNFHPVATFGTTLVMAPLTYDTTTNTTRSTGTNFVRASSTVFASAPVIGDAAFIPLQPGRSVKVTAENATTVSSTSVTGDVINSFVHQNSFAYL